MSDEGSGQEGKGGDGGFRMPDFPSEMTGEQWVEHFWAGDFLPWAEGTEVSDFVIKHFAAKGSGNRKDLNVFFPMCGTSPDMKWVADQGHSVIGCEFATEAGPLFAKNSKLTYTETDAPEVDGKIFHYNEANVKIYCCDFYKFNVGLAGQFDIIWDSAAFVAANQKDKQKYADLLKSLIKPDGKLFLSGVDYPVGTMKGPPFPFKEEHCKQYFSAWNAETLDRLESKETFNGAEHTFIHDLRLFTLK